jgi:hypothetical protein
VRAGLTVVVLTSVVIAVLGAANRASRGGSRPSALGSRLGHTAARPEPQPAAEVGAQNAA